MTLNINKPSGHTGNYGKKTKTLADGREVTWVEKQLEVNDYVCLRSEHGEIFIQNGNFYTAGNPNEPIPANALPAWVKDEVAKLTPETKASVGLK